MRLFLSPHLFPVADNFYTGFNHRHLLLFSWSLLCHHKGIDQEVAGRTQLFTLK